MKNELEFLGFTDEQYFEMLKNINFDKYVIQSFKLDNNRIYSIVNLIKDDTVYSFKFSNIYMGRMFLNHLGIKKYYEISSGRVKIVEF